MKSAMNLKRMKYTNKRMIFSSILDCPYSRAELADKLKLSRAAITMLVDEMIAEGLIYETDIHSGGIGRRPILLDVRREDFFIGGIVVHRRSIEMGFIDLTGKTICQKTIPNSTDPCAKLQEVSNIMLEYIAQYQFPKEKILGIGISSPGPLNTLTGIILNPPNFDSWHNTPIVELLSNRLDFPMQLYNLSDSLVLEEKYYGKGQNIASIMALQVDTEGIGSGIIIHNQLLRDICEIGGMLGHMSISYNGKKCTCGNRGCLERYASIGAILESTPFSTWAEVMDAMETNPEARHLVEQEAGYIATAIINTINMIHLERVVIMGDLNYKHELLEKRINDIVCKRLIIRNYGSTARVIFSDTRCNVRTGAIGFLNAYLQEYNYRV